MGVTEKTRFLPPHLSQCSFTQPPRALTGVRGATHRVAPDESRKRSAGERHLRGGSEQTAAYVQRMQTPTPWPLSVPSVPARAVGCDAPVNVRASLRP